MMTTSRKFSVLAATATGLLLASTASMSGCRMPAETRTDAAMNMATSHIDFWVESSRREVLVGEVVTLTVRDQDTAGRDVTIEWSTTGGELTTERNNRIARLQFDNPGVYTVTGRMYADDVVISDSVDITVNRVR